MAKLFVQSLPSGKETHWESTESLGVLDEPLNTGPARAFYNSPYNSPNYGGFNPRNRVAVLGVVRTTESQIEASAPEVITIKEHSILKSELRNGGSPRTEGTVERTAIINSRIGFPAPG